MASEIISVIRNDVWDFEDRPENQKVIGSRFVLRRKAGLDAESTKCKARIVARGFAQRPGIDVDETFSPVARLSSIRLIVSTAVQRNMYLKQYDVTTAFLNGTLEEKVYLEVPDYLEEVLEYIVAKGQKDDPEAKKAKKMLQEMHHGDKVLAVKKAIYGLRQAGRAWHTCLDRELRNFGMQPSNADTCVYLKGAGHDLLIVIVYVDDLIVACENLTEITRLSNYLERSFEMKSLGDLKHCLGIEFERTQDYIKMHQSTYIQEILGRFSMMDCNPVSTPLNLDVKLTKSDPIEGSKKKLPYRELVGSLQYLSVATRPDISHATSVLGQFNDSFGEIHWIAAKRVLRYLKGTANLGIIFRKGDDIVKGYVDADWGGSVDDRRSYTGFSFICNESAISWDSRKQRTVALSSTEAEYMALCEASKEAIYIRRFLIDLDWNDQGPTVLYNDNMGAQKLVLNPVYHARTKHIDMRHHFVRDAYKSKEIKLEHIASEDMAADVLTKALPRPKHQVCVQLLGLSSEC